MIATDTRPAEDNRRIARVAAFAIAAMPLYLIVPRLIGTALGGKDPTGLPLDAQVAEIVAHPYIYGSFGLLSLIVGPSIMILALALYAHLRAGSPFAARVATTAGVIAGALFLLAGFGPISTAGFMTEMGPQDQQTAIALYVVGQSITDRQVTTSTVLFGAFALIASLLGARAGLLPRALSYVGGLALIVFLVSAVVSEVWLLSVLLMIVWSAWIGVALSRGRQPHGQGSEGVPAP